MESALSNIDPDEVDGMIKSSIKGLSKHNHGKFSIKYLYYHCPETTKV